MSPGSNRTNRSGLCSQVAQSLLEKGAGEGEKSRKNLNAGREAGPKTEVGHKETGQREKRGPGDTRTGGLAYLERSGNGGVDEKTVPENNLEELQEKDFAR